MGKSSTPEAPDYAKLIPEQRAANRADFNTVLGASRPSISSPTGRSTWTRTPGAVDQNAYSAAMENWKAAQAQTQQQGAASGEMPQYAEDDMRRFQVNPGTGLAPGQAAPSATPTGMPTEDQFRGDESWSLDQSLSPQEQQIFDADQRNRLTASGTYDKLLGTIDTSPLDTSSLPQGYSSDPSRLQQLADAEFSSRMRYLTPEMEQQTRGLREDLMSQGFNFTDPAVQTPTGNLQNRQNLLRLQAADQAMLASGREDSRLFNQSEGLRQNRFAEMLTQRNSPLAMIASLRTGSQPQAAFGQAQYSAPGLQGVDELGAAQQDYATRVDANNAENAQSAQLFSALMGLGGNYLRRT